MATVNIKGLDPVRVLQALHDAAVARALHGGYGTGPLAEDEAREVLKEAGSQVIKHVNGRALSIAFAGDVLEVDGYNSANRDNGRDLAQEALAPLIAEHLMKIAPADESDVSFASAVGGAMVAFR